MKNIKIFKIGNRFWTITPSSELQRYDIEYVEPWYGEIKEFLVSPLGHYVYRIVKLSKAEFCDENNYTYCYPYQLYRTEKQAWKRYIRALKCTKIHIENNIKKTEEILSTL